MVLNRYSLIRGDKDWLADKIQRDQSRIIPVYNSTVLYDSLAPAEAVSLTYNSFRNLPGLNESTIFLGISNETPCFSMDITSKEFALELEKTTGAVFRDFRSLMPLLDRVENELLSLARFMSHWHSTHQYCGKCGSRTKSSKAGHVCICENGDCSQSYFPSMDPAVIVLVSYGDKCLLGRQKEWPAGMYSTLAGFVEPGETIEEAVAREVHEESGIHVENIRYQHSQPWLFPGSLMLGFTATATNEKIQLETDELEDARWLTKNEIRNGSIVLPPPVSIAHKLITEWLEES